MEYKLNETFEFNGKKIKCVPSIESDNICEICALNDIGYCHKISCTPEAREDKTGVYFIELKEETNMPPRKLTSTEDVKEQIITPPEGYEIDRENSTFECIKFKKIKPVAWRSIFRCGLEGYGMHTDGTIGMIEDNSHNLEHSCVYHTEKQAKSAQAMAIISQIMANDERFGGVITDEEWKNSDISKYCIYRYCGAWTVTTFINDYEFLAFHTSEQRQLFIEENEDLIKQYFMI